MLIKGTVRFAGLTYDEFETYIKLDLVVSDVNPYLIIIPPKIWHGFQNIGNEEAYILNIPDKPYDHKHPDEERTTPYDARIKFPWEVSLDG
jgi:dTDP-4-dehydrorhamnose 3,5-epimerase